MITEKAGNLTDSDRFGWKQFIRFRLLITNQGQKHQIIQEYRKTDIIWYIQQPYIIKQMLKPKDITKC